MEETKEEQFRSLLAGFKTKWEHQYPEFINYFETYYSGRAGKILITCITAYSIYTIIIINADQWAKCYRRFEHKDTDTNMYLER